VRRWSPVSLTAWDAVRAESATTKSVAPLTPYRTVELAGTSVVHLIVAVVEPAVTLMFEIAGGLGTGVSVGGTGVFIGVLVSVSGVLVGVLVGGTDVLVGGTEVLVGGTEVLVGVAVEVGVLVGGTAVGVGVGVGATPEPTLAIPSSIPSGSPAM
jgi:hypothetical protein